MPSFPHEIICSGCRRVFNPNLGEGTLYNGDGNYHQSTWKCGGCIGTDRAIRSINEGQKYQDRLAAESHNAAVIQLERKIKSLEEKYNALMVKYDGIIKDLDADLDAAFDRIEALEKPKKRKRNCTNKGNNDE